MEGTAVALAASFAALAAAYGLAPPGPGTAPSVERIPTHVRELWTNVQTAHAKKSAAMTADERAAADKDVKAATDALNAELTKVTSKVSTGVTPPPPPPTVANAAATQTDGAIQTPTASEKAAAEAVKRANEQRGVKVNTFDAIVDQAIVYATEDVANDKAIKERPGSFFEPANVPRGGRKTKTGTRRRVRGSGRLGVERMQAHATKLRTALDAITVDSDSPIPAFMKLITVKFDDQAVALLPVFDAFIAWRTRVLSPLRISIPSFHQKKFADALLTDVPSRLSDINPVFKNREPIKSYVQSPTSAAAPQAVPPPPPAPDTAIQAELAAAKEQAARLETDLKTAQEQVRAAAEAATAAAATAVAEKAAAVEAAEKAAAEKAAAAPDTAIQAELAAAKGRAVEAETALSALRAQQAEQDEAVRQQMANAPADRVTTETQTSEPPDPNLSSFPIESLPEPESDASSRPSSAGQGSLFKERLNSARTRFNGLQTLVQNSSIPAVKSVRLNQGITASSLVSHYTELQQKDADMKKRATQNRAALQAKLAASRGTQETKQPDDVDAELKTLEDELNKVETDVHAMVAELDKLKEGVPEEDLSSFYSELSTYLDYIVQVESAIASVPPPASARPLPAATPQQRRMVKGLVPSRPPWRQPGGRRKSPRRGRRVRNSTFRRHRKH